jgi:hypothetical protein
MLAVVLALTGVMPAASAQTTPPPGPIKNFEFIRNLSGMNNITSINVMTYGDGDVLVAVGRFGVKTFDLTDPESPQEIDHLPSEDLMLDSDTGGTFWQSESTNVDQRRKLIFLSRDPRAYNGPQDSGESGVYIVDAADPENLELITFHPIPAGHTSTCIEDCRFLWTGGPATASNQPAEWAGRPIFVTDVRDVRRPYTYPDPIDMGRRNGITDYAHDVQVDNVGIAWVSGRGGVRGYYTSGRQWDPVLEQYRTATAWDPVPYAGGGGPVAWDATGPAVVHNSERPIDAAHRPRPNVVGLRDQERPYVPYAKDGSDYGAHGFEAGELLYATHEDFNGSCAQRGRFYIVSLRGSYNGEAWKSTQENPFDLEVLSSWHPYEQEGYVPGTSNCSGHYFRMLDGMVYMSWYGQGTRVLDVRDPYNPIQVAYFRPNGTSSYTPMLYKGLVYIADSGRGIDIMRLSDAAFDVAATGEGVVAPTMTLAQAKASEAGYEADPIMGWSCPIPTETSAVEAE